jgi:hypothetical protein
MPLSGAAPHTSDRDAATVKDGWNVVKISSAAPSMDDVAPDFLMLDLRSCGHAEIRQA